MVHSRPTLSVREISLNITPEQNKAIGELVDLVASNVGVERAIHPATAISTAARLSGSFLFRTFGVQTESLEPGSILLSEQANEEGTQLINIVGSYLTNSNIAIDQTKIGAVGEDKELEPKLTFLGAISLVQNEALEICKRHGLNMEQSAQSAATATAFIVKECAAQIGAETGFNVAIYGFIEGSKTVPPLFVSTLSKSNQTQKPWYKFW